MMVGFWDVVHAFNSEPFRTIAFGAGLSAAGVAWLDILLTRKTELRPNGREALRHATIVGYAGLFGFWAVATLTVLYLVPEWAGAVVPWNLAVMLPIVLGFGVTPRSLWSRGGRARPTRDRRSSL